MWRKVGKAFGVAIDVFTLVVVELGGPIVWLATAVVLLAVGLFTLVRRLFTPHRGTSCRPCE